jgi:hypothetical protein
MIITATLMAVARIDSRIINRENDFCWLNAMRRAMKEDMFTFWKIVLSVTENQIDGFFVLSVSKIGLANENLYF